MLYELIEINNYCKQEVFNVIIDVQCTQHILE